MIEDLVQKKFEELNLDNNKYFQELAIKYDSKNEQIFKLFEEHNIIINNLNLKLEKIKNNIESDNKKKFNHLTEKIEKSIIQINESNNVFNNESRVDTNIIPNENITYMKSQITNQNKKLELIETKLNQELNKINEIISGYEKKINAMQNINISQRSKKESGKVDEISVESVKIISNEKMSKLSNKTKEKIIIDNTKDNNINNIENAIINEEEIINNNNNTNTNNEKNIREVIPSKKSSKKGSKNSEIYSLDDLLLD